MALKYLNEFLTQFKDSWPASLDGLKTELMAEFHQRLLNTLQKLDLVTRQEFDIQAERLQKAQEKLKALEHKVSLLEKQHSVKLDKESLS